MLTRDRDDVLRAFANVCRHRGAIVARGAGERGTLQCPYHAWTYGLDGCLRAAPRTQRRPGLRARRARAACRWRSAPGARSCSSTPTPDAPPLAEALGDLPGGRARARPRRRRAALPPPRRVRDPGELEDRARELPRVLPLPAQPPGARLGDRRPPADARGARRCARASSTRRTRTSTSAGGIPQGQFHLLFPSLKFNAQPGPAEPVDRPGLAGRARPLPRLPRLLLRAGRVGGVDRGVPRLRRPGRGGGHGAGRGRAGRRGQRAGPGGPAARPRRAARSRTSRPTCASGSPAAGRGR